MATKIIEAKYRVTTPLFLQGANGSEPMLRPPSLKGLLRFWWRALAWSKFSGNLHSIKEKEDNLFGSADTGQSRVILRISQQEQPTMIEKKEEGGLDDHSKSTGEGARYLGYGVIDTKGRILRSYLKAPFDFTLQLRCRRVDEDAIPMLTDALQALGMLGGMGAKSRKGYGSLVLRELKVDGKKAWQPPGSIEDLDERIKTLFGKYRAAGLPEYTALSQGTKCVLVGAGNRVDSLKMLDLVGREMLRFRSWGRGGRVLRGRTEGNFRDDHDLMKHSPGNRTKHPRRIAFGLPHNYGKGFNRHVGPAASDLQRRASPLFIHIHSLADEGGQPLAVLSFLPARFLPKGKSDISVGGDRVRLKREEELYKPVKDFLARMSDPKRRKEPFGKAVEVTL